MDCEAKDQLCLRDRVGAQSDCTLEPPNELARSGPERAGARIDVFLPRLKSSTSLLVRRATTNQFDPILPALLKCFVNIAIAQPPREVRQAVGVSIDRSVKHQDPRLVGRTRDDAFAGTPHAPYGQATCLGGICIHVHGPDLHFARQAKRIRVC